MIDAKLCRWRGRTTGYWNTGTWHEGVGFHWRQCCRRVQSKSRLESSSWRRPRTGRFHRHWRLRWNASSCWNWARVTRRRQACRVEGGRRQRWICWLVRRVIGRWFGRRLWWFCWHVGWCHGWFTSWRCRLWENRVVNIACNERKWSRCGLSSS